MERLRQYLRRPRESIRRTAKSKAAAAVIALSLSAPLISSCEKPLTDTQALELARSEVPEKRIEGVEALEGDGNKLGDLAMHSEHKDVRLAAVEELSESSSAISDIIEESPYADSALAAAEKIGGNQEYMLPLLVGRTKHEAARKALVERIGDDLEDLGHAIDSTDNIEARKDAADALASMMPDVGQNEDLLCKVANYSRKEYARTIALSRLTKSIGRLEEVAVHSLYDNTREKAVRAIYAHMLGGEAAILRIFRSMEKIEERDKSAKKRNEAAKTAAAEVLTSMISRLSDPISLQYIFMHSKDQDIREVAFRKLEGRVHEATDDDTLLLIAENSKDPEKRLAAMNKVKESYRLKHIVHEGPEDVAVASLEKFAWNSEYLEGVALDKENSFEVRKAAIQRLGRNVLEWSNLDESTFEGRMAVSRASYSKNSLYKITEKLSLRISADAEDLLPVAAGGLMQVMDGESTWRDTKMWARVAHKCNDAQLRMGALNRIDSDIELMRIAESSEYADTTLAAAERINIRKSCGLLTNVAINSQHKETRFAVVDRIAGCKEGCRSGMVVVGNESWSMNPYEHLENIAISSKHEDTRLYALRRLAGRQRNLSTVALNTEGRTRKTAVGMLTRMGDRLRLPGALEMVATYSDDADARAGALQRIKGKRFMLKNVIKETRYEDTRQMAKGFLGG